MKSVFVAAAISAAVAVAAPASARDFNGGYAGVAMTLDNIQGSGDAEGIGFSGVGASGFAGYDVPVSTNVFVGVEGNIDLNTADALGLEAKWGWGVSGRLGTKVNDSTALYARVGYARGKLSAGGDSAWFDGVRYGAGLETSLTDTLSLRAEFTQINYEASLINNQGTIGVVFGF